MTSKASQLPSEEYETQVLHFAFQELLLQECRQLEETPLTPEEEELLKLAEGSRAKNIALIDRLIQRRNRAARIKSGLAAVMRVAATVLLIMSFSFGTALAVVPEFRVKSSST